MSEANDGLISKRPIPLYLRVLQLADRYQFHDSLYWRTEATESHYGPVTFFMNCSDLFYWGSADNEEVTEENIGLLEDTMEELHLLGKTAESSLDYIYGDSLFCCRARQMRPQGCCYPNTYQDILWPLFDACGPERPKGLGNPYAPGEREKLRREKGNEGAKAKEELLFLSMYDLEERV